MRCSRYSKSTRAQCWRSAAEWPCFDDLPAPVVACAGHLSPPEWTACQEARKRYYGLAAERRKQEAAERDHLEIPPPSNGEVSPGRPCIGKCISKQKEYGDDGDGAITECARCDGFVCLNCGMRRVDDELGWCDTCDRVQPDDASYEPVTPQGNETYDGLFPQRRLTSAVARIVAATGRSYRSVNRIINQQSGVRSRVGAGEHVIRRAAWVAQYWMQQLDEFSAGS